MSIKIVLDSTADLLPELAEKFDVVHLTVNFGEEEFIDGVTITRDEFYAKLIESDVMPTTSQASPEAFENVFRKIAENGDEVIAITVASKLSGTYQSACIAASEFPGKVRVIDSKTVAIGTAILAEYALSLVESGLSADEITAKIEEKRGDIRIVALIDTLEYLKKGGRLSKTAAFAGTLLNLKPVVSVEDGEISVLGKARGSKQGNNFLVKEIERDGGVDFSMPVLLGYTGHDKYMLEKYVEDSRFLWEGNVENLRETCIGSVIGTHVGPGAIAVAFFKQTTK
ncbi:MAG: DegV family protein [Oscillospiraceae bacterium]|nr:DegV family protein [Oscillospiraceae bacterium]MBQ4643994.1 DegV family protein [Oscillospiraceae bacterium]